MKPLAHYEKRYAVSPEGFVFNLSNNTKLRPSTNANGYVKVGLANGDGTSTQKLLHIIIAKHFIPNPYDYPQVNHKNGIKADCSADNLEWCSAQQNAEHALRTGLRSGYMSADDKEKYLQLVLSGQQVGDLANQLGRRPESLHKMLRETAIRLKIHDQWQVQMKENRRAAAVRNLEPVNSRNTSRS